jgi:hypothetical protein
LALPRLAAAARTPAVVERLRAASALPGGDYVAIDDDATASDVPTGASAGGRPAAVDAARARRRDRAGRRVRRWVAHRVRDRLGLRPAVGAGPARPSTRPAFAVGVGGDRGAAIDRARTANREGRDRRAARRARRALDELAKLLDASVPADGRTERVLRVRSARRSEAAAQREKELADYNAPSTTRRVGRPALHRAVAQDHAGDRHYNWHRIRADRAEADVDKLWNLHEGRVTTRMKRAIRSTKVGDAAARALGAGPLVPPPSSDLGPEGPDADAPA